MAAVLAVRPEGSQRHALLRLLAANSAAQLITLAAYPLLTRLYTPSQLGILGSLVFATMILQPVSALRYEMALPLCRSTPEARQVLALSLLVVLLTSALLTAALALLPGGAQAAIGAAAPYRLFLPLSLLAFGIFNVLSFEATRTGRYGEISRTRISQALVGPALQIGLGLLWPSTAGLLAGYAVGLFGGTWLLARPLWRARAQAPVTWSELRAAALRYRRLPLYSSWAGVLLTASATLGNLVFTSLYGATIGGFIYLSDRILIQPLRVSANALNQVFIGAAGKAIASERRRLPSLFVGALLRQAAVTIAWLSGLLLIGHIAIPLVFGSRWAAAVPFLDVMVIGYLPQSVALPVSHTLTLMGRQRLSAALETLRVAVLAMVIAGAWLSGASPLRAVLAYSIAQAVTQCLILGVMLLKVRRFAAQAGRPVDAAANSPASPPCAPQEVAAR